MRLKCLPPVSRQDAEILILGSFPGPMSLEKRQYYAYPRNDFWNILRGLFKVEGGYAERCRQLKKNRIALWDVLGSCERVGASDTRIQKPKPNDIPGFLSRHPKIRAIYLNGRKAESAYKKYFSAKIKLPARYLPSTSPAHAVKEDRKIKAWRMIQYSL